MTAESDLCVFAIIESIINHLLASVLNKLSPDLS